MASGVYGEYRMTYDVDIVVDLRPQDVDALCDAFPTPQYYVSRSAAAEAVQRTGQFNVIEPSTGQKIDLMISPRTPWGRSQLQRRREEWVLPDLLGYVADPEDIILSKLVYYREGESEKHPRDIAAMLKVSGEEIDCGYIESWLEELNIAKQWENVLRRMEPKQP